MCGEREKAFLWSLSLLIPVLVAVGIQKAWRQPGGGWDLHILDTPPQGSGYQQNEDVALLSITLKHFSLFDAYLNVHILISFRKKKSQQ
jgi:hypothetical protein